MPLARAPGGTGFARVKYGFTWNPWHQERSRPGAASGALQRWLAWAGA